MTPITRRRRQRGIGHNTHQAGTAAAIDQLPAAPADQSAMSARLRHAPEPDPDVIRSTRKSKEAGAGKAA